ncbi:MAG: biotin carboxylase N-terminal domain-containing protein [Oceanicaulis sp.]
MLTRSFASVLIANRGEIAVRVLREARASGRRAIAVYSDADAGAMHVREADEAVRIGPAPASQSYLDIDAILDAAKRTGAEAIHPGYGFLSENAAFARAVIEAGLVWIGPPPEAIQAMGDKARAKQLMIEAGVPTVPGWQGDDQSADTLAREAEKIGYPLLIKAVAGGGGRGMRVVRSAEDFKDALASAKREAKSSFGDQTVLLEKFVERGRHVEIQVFADAQGNTIHLGERDCSAQRRRQKVIEEAPSPAVDEDLRARMGADAVAAAKAVDYVGAGTVEFLLDADGAYFFLEMNTRLQVEHPVTEEVTGLNLVQLQFDIAAGAPLPATQDDVALCGHAIELRLYAEDPLDGFAPQSGPIAHYAPDGVTSGVRIDRGVATADRIGTDYDAMIAKLIGTGETRDDAITALRAHLRDAPLLGVTTNRDFLLRLLDDARFRTGAVTTGDLDAWAEEKSGPFAPVETPFEALAIAAAVLCDTRGPVLRSASVTRFDLDLEVGGETATVRVEQQREGGVRVTRGEDAAEIAVLGFAGGALTLRHDGVTRTLPAACCEDGGLHLGLPELMVRIAEPSPVSTDPAADPSKITAPVSGAVAAVHVKPGDRVTAGQVVAVMEAMKMEMRLEAGADGIVAAVNAETGGQAAGGFVLIELDLQSQD